MLNMTGKKYPFTLLHEGGKKVLIFTIENTCCFLISNSIPSDKPELVKFLIDAGANVSAEGFWKLTPLHYSAREGDCLYFCVLNTFIKCIFFPSPCMDLQVT